MINISIILIGVIVFVSFQAWKDSTLYNKLIFSPRDVAQNKEWYRFVTSGFIHADQAHLFFNCFSLYMFADVVINMFELPFFFGNFGQPMFLLLFLLGVIVSEIPSYLKNKDNYYYRSLGASGGVSSVIFAGIVMHPTMGMGLLFLPFRIPAFIFGGLYLLYSYYMTQKSQDNINHSAHFVGSIFGVLFVLVLKPQMLNNFIHQVQNWL